MFSSATKNWSYQGRTSGQEWLYGFTMATFKNEVYLFGGKEFWSQHRQDVYQMNAKFGWIVIPEKMRSYDRHGFSALQYENRIVHFGGEKMQHAECWTMNSDGRNWFEHFNI